MCGQARAEEYSEVVAFVGLLNTLMKASGTTIPGQGRPYSHITQFVRAEVLGQLHQRAYRLPALFLLSPIPEIVIIGRSVWHK